MRMRLLTILIPITLVIAAAFLVPFTVDIDAHRNQITSQISRDMNIDIIANGPVKLRLLPSPALQFEKIVSVVKLPEGRPMEQGRKRKRVSAGRLLWLCPLKRLMPGFRWPLCWTAS